MSRTFLIFLITLILSLGCKTIKTTESISFDFNAGLNGILRGDDEQKIIQLLGTPDLIDREWEQRDGTKYFNYYNQGIQFLTKDNIIQTTFLFYISKDFKQYSGEIMNINENISIEEVIKLIGEPDRISKSVISEFGQYPGARETYLSYVSKGIAVTFYDEKLADIRFYKSK